MSEFYGLKACDTRNKKNLFYIIFFIEAIVRLWRIPGWPAELYLNFDCGLYSTNLYEELMKMFSKVTFSTCCTQYFFFFLC